MKTAFLFLSSAIACAFFFAAPLIVNANAGTGSVLPADRLSIEQSQYSGQWKGNDLTVEYNYSKDRGQMDISGNVRFASSLVLGYTRLEDFRLGAIFLDKNGRVLQEIGLATNRDSFDPISFNRRINLPSNAVSIAFSYQGKAIEGADEGGSGLTSFWFYPIR
jgi:hypothetical protein